VEVVVVVVITWGIPALEEILEKSTCTKTTELKDLGKPLCTVKCKWKNQINQKKKSVQRFKKDTREIS